MSAVRALAIACAAALLLSACGNKGDLVLPPTKPAKPQTHAARRTRRRNRPHRLDRIGPRRDEAALFQNARHRQRLRRRRLPRTPARFVRAADRARRRSSSRRRVRSAADHRTGDRCFVRVRLPHLQHRWVDRSAVRQRRALRGGVAASRQRVAVGHDEAAKSRRADRGRVAARRTRSCRHGTCRCSIRHRFISTPTSEADEYRIDLDGESIAFGAMSMGNPHAVIEVADVSTAPLQTIGAALSIDRHFAQGATPVSRKSSIARTSACACGSAAPAPRSPAAAARARRLRFCVGVANSMTRCPSNCPAARCRSNGPARARDCG